MNCQGCGYSLFNLARENCPECGRPFEVTDYRFDPGAVEFLCPDCNQPYPVIDEKGLPRGGEFACLSCGTALRVARMVVRPLTPSAAGRLRGSPWHQTEELGFWRGWWQTVRLTMFRPARFFDCFFVNALGSALEFAGVTLLLGLAGGGLPWAAIILARGAPFDTTRLADPVVAAVLGYWILFATVGAVLVPTFLGLIVSASVHLALLMLAPQRKTFADTCAVALYSFGPAALLLIPVAGLAIAPMWMASTVIMGVRTVHQTSVFVAMVAVLWLPTLLVLLLFLIP
jgi:hypothetical protein